MARVSSLGANRVWPGRKGWKDVARREERVWTLVGNQGITRVTEYSHLSLVTLKTIWCEERKSDEGQSLLENCCDHALWILGKRPLAVKLHPYIDRKNSSCTCYIKATLQCITFIADLSVSRTQIFLSLGGGGGCLTVKFDRIVGLACRKTTLFAKRKLSSVQCSSHM